MKGIQPWCESDGLSYNFFSPDETDDMESLFHIAGIGDYLDQLIIPSHE